MARVPRWCMFQFAAVVLVTGCYGVDELSPLVEGGSADTVPVDPLHRANPLGTPNAWDRLPAIGFPELPATLDCVSDAGTSRLHPDAEVLRIRLGPETDEGRRFVVSAGEQFRLHEGGNRVNEPRQIAELPATASWRGELGLVVTTPDGDFSVELQKRGAFYFGELTERSGATQEQRRVTCWDNAEVFPSPWGGERSPSLPARLDWATGRCLDDDGFDALNLVPIEFVRETGQGSCADLRGQKLNGEDYGYPELSWWNLTGANLDGAQLVFANLTGVSLHSAKLSELQFGYAVIQGTIDDFTELPAQGCEVEAGSWGGATASCTR